MGKKLFIAALGALLVFVNTNSEGQDYSQHPQPVVKMQTPHGDIYCELYPDVAPKHAERIKQLCADKFYDGIRFHRIVPGFVAQAGDPASKKGVNAPGVGSGGSDYPDLPLEVSPTQKNTRGALAAARTNDPNSANSQFYIVLQDATHLNMQYTVFGRVLGDGMKVVDKIKAGDPIVSLAVVKP